MTPLYAAALVAFGLAIGAFGTMVGIGGGFLMVPIFIALGMAPKDAAGTSLFVVLANALSGTVSFARQGRIQWRTAVLFAVAGAPGAVIGAWVDQFIPHRAFYALCALVIVLAAARMLFSRPQSTDAPPDHAPPYSAPTAIAIAFFTGFLASILGIGGGIINVPAMIFLFGFAPHAATATSTFIIALTSALGTASHAWYGDVRYAPAIAVAIGAVPGALLGAWLAKRSRPTLLVKALGVAMFVAGAWLAWKAVSS